MAMVESCMNAFKEVNLSTVFLGMSIVIWTVYFFFVYSKK